MLVVVSIVEYIAPPLSPAILFSNLLTPLKSIFPYKLTTAPPLEVSDSLFKKVLPLIRALLETIAPPKLYAELPLNILFSISKLSLIIAPAILPVERLLLNIEFVIVNFVSDYYIGGYYVLSNNYDETTDIMLTNIILMENGELDL